MSEELIKELCFYLGELDYVIENSNDYFAKAEIEEKRRYIHLILGLPYKVKRIKINYKQLTNKL